jgi:deoxyribonuclease-4
MAQTAESIGANVFQFFTRNPRGGAARPVDGADIEAFLEFRREKDIGPILAHAPYTLNAAGAEARVREFAESVLADDLRRLALTPGAMYNLHPGSHVGQGAQKGIELLADILNRVLDAGGGFPETTVLVETMAGKGSEIGRDFSEIASILDKVRFPLGVCLDTCHVWDGGYDLAGDLEGVLKRFDSEIGLGRLKAIHLNDTMNVLGAHKDRHERLGKGKLALPAIRAVVTHPKLRDLPFYLETPCDLQGYKEEIALVKSLWQGSDMI